MGKNYTYSRSRVILHRFAPENKDDHSHKHASGSHDRIFRCAASRLHVGSSTSGRHQAAEVVDPKREQCGTHFSWIKGLHLTTFRHDDEQHGNSCGIEILSPFGRRAKHGNLDHPTLPFSISAVSSIDSSSNSSVHLT